MRIAYFDCSSGISGDMLVGAFLDTGVPFDELRSALNSLPLKGYTIAKREVKKNGLRALHFSVEVKEIDGHPHPHRGLAEITEIIHQSKLPEEVKQGALQSFKRLAEVEAEVHGTTPDTIHFHEVGAIDAIVDIVSAHWCWWYLKIQKGYCSVVNTGGGTVTCAHGTLPVPAPATALLLRNYTILTGTCDSELTTPTGAVLLNSFAKPTGEPVPPFNIVNIGTGAGSKDIPNRANVFRLFIGECPEETRSCSEEIWVVETNIDDMSGELIPVAIEELLSAGARDAFIIPTIAKKGRPAYLLTVLCEASLLPAMRQILFEKTSTFGIRYRKEMRTILERKWIPVETPWGKVNVKIGYLGENIYQISPEFEECHAIAKTYNIPLQEIYHHAITLAQKTLK
ncbi:MAG: nickel pincer cofactor biosynthesis protein LarC [Candidatus Hydrogenedens sp.]|nr:nickel pincer cofactor biosynthesis protein LarC [Candidatus Hydrogenedens sp.]